MSPILKRTTDSTEGRSAAATSAAAATLRVNGPEGENVSQPSTASKSDYESVLFASTQQLKGVQCERPLSCDRATKLLTSALKHASSLQCEARTTAIVATQLLFNAMRFCEKNLEYPNSRPTSDGTFPTAANSSRSEECKIKEWLVAVEDLNSKIEKVTNATAECSSFVGKLVEDPTVRKAALASPWQTVSLILEDTGFWVRFAKNLAHLLRLTSFYRQSSNNLFHAP